MKTRTRRIVLAIASAALLALALCATAGCSGTNNEDVIRKTISDELDAYKNLDDAAMSEVVQTAEMEGLGELGISGKEFATAVLDGFDYRIDSIKVNGNTATANVTITSKSMSDFENKFNDELKTIKEKSDSMSESKLNSLVGEYAMEAIKDADNAEQTAVLKFELQGNTWVSTNVSEVLGNLDSLVFAR